MPKSEERLPASEFDLVLWCLAKRNPPPTPAHTCVGWTPKHSSSQPASEGWSRVNCAAVKLGSIHALFNEWWALFQNHVVWRGLHILVAISSERHRPDLEQKNWQVV